MRADAVELSPVPDEQVAQTIGRMRELALEDSTSKRIQDLAREFAYGVDRIRYCGLVHQFVQRLMSFTPDEETGERAPEIRSKIEALGGQIVEVLIRPLDILSSPTKIGDCDDYSMLAASLLLAGGIPCKFCTVAADGSGNWSHVYIVAYPDGKRYPLDTSHGEYPGWETERSARRKEWPMMVPYTLGPLPPGVSGLMGSAYLHNRGPGMGGDWTDAIIGWGDTALNFAGNILTTHYKVPETPPPGTVYRAPDGTVISTVGAGGVLGTGTGGISTNTLLLAGVGMVGLIILMSSMNRR